MFCCYSCHGVSFYLQKTHWNEIYSDVCPVSLLMRSSCVLYEMMFQNQNPTMSPSMIGENDPFSFCLYLHYVYCSSSSFDCLMSKSCMKSKMCTTTTTSRSSKNKSYYSNYQSCLYPMSYSKLPTRHHCRPSFVELPLPPVLEPELRSTLEHSSRTLSFHL